MRQQGDNVNRLQKELKKNKISAAILFNFNETPDANFMYFAKFDGYGCLIVPKDKKPVLIVPQLEYERAKRTKIKTIAYKRSLWEEIRKHAKGKTMGIDYDSITVSLFNKLKEEIKADFTDASGLCYDVREQKTEEELSIIKQGCRISDRIFKKCFWNFKNFKTEMDVKDFMENETRNLGLTQSFRTIVASGKNASQPHYATTNKKLQQGFCVIDFGIKFKGFCTDCTRTVFIGKPTEKEKELYNIVLQAHDKAAEHIKKAKSYKELSEKAKEELGKYEKYFIHSLGHGIGIEVHESPRVSIKSGDKIKPNTVFTIEPGIYIHSRLGIRIEDMYVSGNHSPLTKISRQFRAVKPQ